MKYVTRKFDGDDMYSWAVFKKADIPKGRRGIIFYGEAKPIVCGLSRNQATYHKKSLEDKASERRDK